MPEEFVCPKPETGVKCFDCEYRDICTFLNLPARKPQTYPPPEEPTYKPFSPLPLETPHRKYDQGIPKHLYKMLLLISEDFQLTKPELRDLCYYCSRFQHPYPKGGRNKSWERIFAIICIQLLERDKRPIYTKNKDYYDERYKFTNSDFKELYDYVEKEIRRITPYGKQS